MVAIPSSCSLSFNCSYSGAKPKLVQGLMYLACYTVHLKNKIMENKERKMEEQDHPLKNTDHAFIKVGKHGEPVIPETAKEERAGKDKKDQAKKAGKS
jgi:hypothetical protein